MNFYKAARAAIRSCVSAPKVVRRVTRNRSALTCGLAAAAYPYLAFYGIFLFSDLVFTLMVLLSCYFYT